MCRCLQCGRLFRLDPAVQVVSHPPRSFHSVGDLLQRKLPEIVKLPRSDFHSKEQDEHLAKGQPGLSPLDLEYAPSGFGFDFCSAETQDFRRILHRLTVFVIEVNRQKIEHMTEFVQQSKRLTGKAVARIKPNVYQPRAADSGLSPGLRA